MQGRKTNQAGSRLENDIGGGIPPFLHNSPANFESYAKNRYAKLCKSMQNYAKLCKIMQKLFKNSRNLK